MNPADDSISNKYQCHSWLEGNAKFIIGTQDGEILVLESTGEYCCTLPDSPFEGRSIECIIPFQRGFIIGCDEGKIYAYEKVDEAGSYPF